MKLMDLFDVIVPRTSMRMKIDFGKRWVQRSIDPVARECNSSDSTTYRRSSVDDGRTSQFWLDLGNLAQVQPGENEIDGLV